MSWPATENDSLDHPTNGHSAVFGSEVEMIIPDSQPAPVASSSGEGRAKPRVLLIEDDWRTHTALRKILTKLGWEVQSAMTVSGGLALLGLKPDAVVLDLMLPDGDGVAVLRKVRSERLELRIAVTTGVDDPRRLEEVRRLRPDALLRKPLELGDLLRAIGADRSD